MATFDEYLSMKPDSQTGIPGSCVSGPRAGSPEFGQRDRRRATGGMLMLAANAALVLASSGHFATAATLLNDGAVNNVSAPTTEDLEVRDGGGPPARTTTLNVLSGADIPGIKALETSVLNISGGTVQNNVSVEDQATFQMTGGTVLGIVELSGNAQGQFQGGTVTVFGLDGQARATVDGGQIDDDMDALGTSELTVLNTFVNDDVDAGDQGVMHLRGGVFDEDVTASDAAIINISGGQFVRIFSREASLVANQGTVNVTGGTFGTSGRNEGGAVVATLGGVVNFANAQIAGLAESKSPTATLSAALNGVVNVNNVAFGQLALEAKNGGALTLHEFSAKEVSATVVAGGILNLLGGQGEELMISAELGSQVTLRGGDFDHFQSELQTGAEMRVYGTSFVVNGIPITELDQVLGDSNAFVEETGELRLVGGTIVGKYLDGTSFQLDFTRGFASQPPARIFLVPEPVSGGLAAVGCLAWILIGRRRRQFGSAAGGLLISLAVAAGAAAHEDSEEHHSQPAMSAKEQFEPTLLPDRILLTWAGDPAHTQNVSWRTSTGVLHSFVEYAVETGGPNFVDSSVRIEAATQAFESDLGTYHIHTARMAALAPATRYSYRVGDGVNWSEWFQFTTAGTEPKPFSFIYFGDAQNDIRSMWSRVIRAAHSDAPKAAFMLHAGDLINDAENDAQWGEWFSGGHWLNAMVPCVATPGNHEYKLEPEVEGQARRSVVSKYWRPTFSFPENGPPGLEETVYWFDYQGVRFVMLNSNEQLETQVEWLKKTLQTNQNRWTIVAFHHPVYSSARGRDNEALRKLWKPVFDEYRVDLVLQGHDHSYARTGLSVPENVGTGVNVKEGPTVYVVSVSGPKQYRVEERPFFERAASGAQLYQIIHIDGDTLQYEARLADGKLYDAFQLLKRPGQFNELNNDVPETPEVRLDGGS